MNTSIKLTISTLMLLVSTSLPLSVLAQGDKPTGKVFNATMFPAADGSKIWLCLEKYQADHKINVELLDKRGEVMFNEELPAKGGKKNTYRQRFDLSQIGDGTYTFRISSAKDQTEEMTFKLATPSLTEVPARLISLN